MEWKYIVLKDAHFCVIDCGATHSLNRGKLFALMIKISHSENSRAEYFSVNSENDDTHSK